LWIPAVGFVRAGSRYGGYALEQIAPKGAHLHVNVVRVLGEFGFGRH